MPSSIALVFAKAMLTELLVSTQKEWHNDWASEWHWLVTLIC